MLSIRVQPWTAPEDELLLALVEEFGRSRWQQIGNKFRESRPGSTRTNLQCRERYFNHLHPGIHKGNWTDEEKETVFQLHRVYGNQWAKIAKHMPWRTENSIKCFFNSAVKKALKGHNRATNLRCMRSLRSLIRDTNTTIALGMGQQPACDTVQTPWVGQQSEWVNWWIYFYYYQQHFQEE